MADFKEIMKKQRSSSIFSQQSEEDFSKVRPNKRLSQDFSDKTTSYIRTRNKHSESPNYRPCDHSISDIFGDYPSEYYRKDIRGYSKDHLLKPRNTEPDFSDKIHNKRPSTNASFHNISNENSKFRRKSIEFLNFQLGEELSNKSRSKSVLKNIGNTKNQTSITENIVINGLKPQDDEITIKSLCQGLHIIKIQTEIDNFTGKCLGKATLQMRAHESSSEIDCLKSKLIKLASIPSLPPSGLPSFFNRSIIFFRV